MHRPYLLVTTLFVSLPAFAQIYQWYDAEGKPHYADVAPPGVNATLLQVRPGSAPDPAGSTAPAGAAAPKSLAERELEFRQRRAEAAENQAKAADAQNLAADRARSCEQARNQLAALKSGQRITRMNSKGEREYLNDAELADETARTEKHAESVCK